MDNEDIYMTQEIQLEKNLVGDYYNEVLFNVDPKYPITESWVYDMIQRCQADGISARDCVINIETNYKQVEY